MNFIPDLLATKCKSGIKIVAGRGLKPGERVAELRGEILDLVGWTQYLQKGCIQVSPTQFLQIEEGSAKHIVHSCEPNLGLVYTLERTLFLVAIKPIQPLELVSWDFSTTMSCGEEGFDCDCRAKSCRRKIKNYDTLPEETRRQYEYLGIVAPYLAPTTVIR